jgi:hypothetical protein
MANRVPARAAKRMPHGSLVRIERGRALLEPDLARAQGVTKRPHVTHATHHARNEQLLVETDGGIMADVGGSARWVEIRNGRIVEC